MRILICEDEKPLARALAKIFEKNNYSADAVFNGEDALDYLRSGNYDVCILDIMMPIIDGVSVLKRIRSEGNLIPIIMLTAKSDVDDKVFALDSGANDYLTKPFDTKELLARIRAVTRDHSVPDCRLALGDIVLDRSRYTLSSPLGEYALTNKEYQMMEMLMKNSRQLIPTTMFMEKIWGLNTDTEINVVWVYISYLRKKLASLSDTVEIKARRNAGYSLVYKDDQEI